ncbi:acylphosphatase [Ureibacillus sp. NPDC094379]
MAQRVHVLLNIEFTFQSTQSIHQKALDLGLKGFCSVTNKQYIEIEVEGKNSSIREFLHYLQKGYVDSRRTCTYQKEIFEDIKGYTTFQSNLV